MIETQLYQGAHFAANSAPPLTCRVYDRQASSQARHSTCPRFRRVVTATSCVLFSMLSSMRSMCCHQWTQCSARTSRLDLVTLEFSVAFSSQYPPLLITLLHFALGPTEGRAHYGGGVPPYMDPPVRKSAEGWEIFFDPYWIIVFFDGEKFSPL